MPAARVQGDSRIGGAFIEPFAFDPSQLFINNIQGAWYDPSDNATMFQDAAGLTPVTAVEQPVGLIFDKRLGPTARRNLRTYTEQFDNAAGWLTQNASVSANTGTAPDGTTTADTVTATAATGIVYNAGGFSAQATSYTVSVYAKAGVTNQFRLDFVMAAYASGASCTFTLTGSGTASAITHYGASSGFTATITSVGSGWYRCTLSGLASVNIWYMQCVLANLNDTASFWGAQLEVGSSASAYQKITSGIGGEWTPGNHAYQSTAASRPVLRARYNLLTYSEDFGNAAPWYTYAGVTKTGTAAVNSPIGTTAGVYEIDMGSTGGSIDFAGALYQPYTTQAASYTLTMYVRAKTGSSTIRLSITSGVGGYGTSDVAINDTEWTRVSFTSSVPGGGGNVAIRNNAAGNSGSVYIWGAQLLTAADAAATGNAYQRIVDATTYATGGVFRPYLAFDGVDDRLQTASVNIASNAVSLFAGHSIQTAGGWGSIVASGVVGGGGVFQMISDTTGAVAYQNVRSEGTLASQVNSSTFAYPYLDVWTMQAQISTDTLIARRDGAQTATSSSDQGSGSYASNIMYVGSYNGANWHYPGRIYGLIVRGAASSAVEVAQTESWLNAKTGAY